MLEIIITQRVACAEGLVFASADSGYLFGHPCLIRPLRMGFKGLARMANPQWEEGFVKIATEIWESLCKTRIPGQVRQVVDVIIRKTWGFNKKWDWISLDQFSDLTGMCKPHVSRALRQAQSMNLITKKGNVITYIGNKDGVSYCFVKDYETWKPLPKKVTLPKKVIGLTKKGNQPLPILGTTIDTLTIDTSTKDIPSPKKSGDYTMFENLRLLYIEICKRLPAPNQVSTWSSKRQKQINARWKAHPDLDWWRIYFERVAASKYLCEGKDTWNGADFGWIMLPSNMEKILEGRYDNKKEKRGQLTSEKDYGPEGGRPF